MANKCLVTKLKGVVDNPNLKKLGELDFTFENATGDYQGMIDVLEVYSAAEYDYEVVGTNVSLSIASSYPLSPVPAALTGTRTGTTFYVVSGTGKIKLTPKYQFTRLCLRPGVKIDNIDDVRAAFMGDNFGIQMEYTVDDPIPFETLNYPTKFRENSTTHIIRLPYIVNVEDYKNVELFLEANSKPMFTMFKQGGNGCHMNGDLINIAQVCIDQNAPLYGVSNRFSQQTQWISDLSKFTQVCADYATSFVILGLDGSKSDPDCTKFATWKYLQYLNWIYTTNEWKPVFDAWKALGTYNGRTVEVYVRGTYNGADIYELGHHLVFDAQGNYSFAP